MRRTQNPSFCSWVLLQGSSLVGSEAILHQLESPTPHIPGVHSVKEKPSREKKMLLFKKKKIKKIPVNQIKSSFKRVQAQERKMNSAPPAPTEQGNPWWKQSRDLLYHSPPETVRSPAGRSRN